MPDPYSGAYFGIDEDPMGRPGGQTAAGAFARAYPERSGSATGGIGERNRTLWDMIAGRPGEEYAGPQEPGWQPPNPAVRDSSGATGGAGDRRRNFWDRLLGRRGREYAGPQEAYGPPGRGGTGAPIELHPGVGTGPLPPQGAGESYGPPTPPIKPVTGLTSSSDLAERIRALINPLQIGGAPQLGMPGSWDGTMPVRDVPYELPSYVTMADPAVHRQRPSMGESAALGARPGGNQFGGQRFGGNRFGDNPFGPQRRAGGGFMGEAPNVPDMPQFTPVPAPLLPAPMAPMAMPPMPQEASGNGGSSDGGMGDIIKIGMQVLPFLLNEGGPVAQRGGYPDLYDRPVRQGYFATGGASNYVAPDGRGDGRSDHIEARLSPGEYVFDAETTALLGDGDSAAGARKLDKMRESVRKQKGAKLAKGDISPKAKKHAEEYLSAGLSRSALKNVGR